ncbi:MAG: 50S ribosomal protein L14e [Candidatus Caldarchaeum sp.]|nr:50S ribosomal protein L14e [Candidatus Caldarchaeum sp.]MCX8201587.1 50S ribosomal protein L14e [Candidatus Caldarchaeum sp.]MDW8063621.1 50S ribosomal protein L14e [Candidatus Caldarchaeum sp.]MDW8435780.1 50S ribosomal protein L14e [Candidatus Caldarchaeum sp.]
MVDESLVGRVVIKTRGRDAGCKGVVVAVYADGHVLVTGPKSLTGLRRKRVNVRHILPTPQKLEIKKDASDDEVLKTIKEAGLEKYMVEKIEIDASSVATKL